MIESLLVGLLLGFILAMPPGPIGVVAMKAGLTGDLKRGVLIGVGAGSIDAVYCVVIMTLIAWLGATQAAIDGWFAAISDEYPIAFLAMKLAVVAAMIAYGVVNFRVKRTHVPLKERKVQQPSIQERIEARGPFFLGFGMGLANLANPTFLPSLIFTLIFVVNLNFVEATYTNAVVFGIAFAIGTVAWMYILVRLICKYKDRMSAKLIEGIHKFTGLTFIGFGTYLGLRAVSPKLPELVRFLAL